MKSQIVKQTKQSHITVDKTMDEKYNVKVLFKEKYEKAMLHLHGRDMQKEIDILLEKEKNQ